MEHTEITPTELIHKIYNRSDRFRISDTFPCGYIVWNLVAWRVKDEETALRIIEQAHHEEINFSNYHRYE